MTESFNIPIPEIEFPAPSSQQEPSELSDEEIMKDITKIPLFPKQIDEIPTPRLEEPPVKPQEPSAPDEEDIMEGIAEVPLFPKQEKEISASPLNETPIKLLTVNVIVEILENVKSRKSKKVFHRTAITDLRKIAKDQGIPVQEELIKSMIADSLSELQEYQFLGVKGQFLIKTENWKKDKILEVLAPKQQL